MKKVHNLVPVEDFDIDLLREAFLQGRLYIQPEETSEAAIREEGIQAILQYVSRIDACASRAYTSTIRQLWEELLRSPELGPLFFLNRYRSSRGQPNWYRVNAVVAALLEHNIYRKETYTALQLHMLMEQSEKRTNRYSGMNRYLLGREELKALLKIAFSWCRV